MDNIFFLLLSYAWVRLVKFWFTLVTVVLKLLCLPPSLLTKTLYFLQYGVKRPWQWLEAQVLMGLIDGRRVPSHIAVVMDGNRRFAQSVLLQSTKLGHEQGAQKLREFVEWCLRYEGLREVTVWALSTDNLASRNPREIDDLWALCEEHLPAMTASSLGSLRDRGVQVRVIGERARLPPRIKKIVEELEQRISDAPAAASDPSQTQNSRQSKNNNHRALNSTSSPSSSNSTHSLSLSSSSSSSSSSTSSSSFQQIPPRLILNIALPYGGREEIATAASTKGTSVEEISAGMYTLSDPDLIIRSGGEFRLSGFMMWQSMHAELFFSSQLWPCFSLSHFLSAIYHYQQRQRRFGS